MKTKVFALLVGIDTYHGDITIDNMATFPPLQGCVNDINRIRDWLKKDPSLDAQVVMLTNQSADKASIVKQFESHLSKAKSDDTVLFYYSGHGTVEKADSKVWTSEHDGRLEGIVCYYTGNKSGKFLLADKELRYLLKRLSDKTQAHVVAIFDCCHSGDNTRSGDGTTQDKIVKKQIEFKSDKGGEKFLVFPQRNWEDFVFSKELAPAAFKGKFIDDVLPPGRYVQISACESNESALEVNGSGVLTSHLLQILQGTGGNLTYRDLLSRVRNATRYRFGQRPKVYVPNDYADLQESGFLKKPVGTTASDATLQYNQAGEYRINRGAAHHVEAGLTTISFTGKDGKPVTGYVVATTLDSATVKFPSPALSNIERKDYTVQLSGLANRTVRVHLDNRDLSDKSSDALLAALNAPENAAYIALEDDPQKADITLIAWKGMLYLTRANDDFRPLAIPEEATNPQAIQLIVNQLRHISQWKFTEQLKNKGVNALPEHFLKTEIFAVDAQGKETLIALKDGAIPIQLYSIPNPNGPGVKWTGSIKVRVTNLSNADLYVGAAYMSSDFGCNVTALLDPIVSTLEPKQSKYLRDHKTGVIKLKLDETTRLFNWPANKEALKLFYSSEFFDMQPFALSGLPTPDGLLTRGKGMDEEEDAEERKPVMNGWNAYTVALSIGNPLYNKPDMEEIKQYTGANAAKQLAHFMNGLYFPKEKA